MTIGNGRKITFDGKIIVTGDSADIPAAFTVFNKTNFPALTFTAELDGLMDYELSTGIHTFKRRGILDVSAIVNFSAGATPTEIQVSPMRDQGAGFETLNARTGSVTVLINQQVDFQGTLHIQKGDKLRFDVSNPNNNAIFKTDILDNGAIVPAAIIDFKMWVL